jgi:hypothetical protein
MRGARSQGSRIASNYHNENCWLSADVLGDLTEALSESDLPYKVDIIELRAVDPAFRAMIEQDMVALPL